MGSDLNGDVSVEIMLGDRDHPQKAEIDQIEAEGANNQWSLNSDVFNGANGIVDIITTGTTNEGLEFFIRSVLSIGFPEHQNAPQSLATLGMNKMYHSMLI